MKKLFAMSFVLLFASTSFASGYGPLTLAQFFWPASAQAEPKHTIIAASGAAAPAGGNYSFFLGNAFSAGLRGRVAFDTILTGPSTSGVFVGDGSRTSAIA